MPDPGDTAKGDKGQGAGWSKSPSSPPSSGTGPRGPESSWGTRGGASGGSLSGGQLSNYGGGGNANLGGSNSGGSGPRGPESSWGTRGSPTGGALSGSQLSNPYGRGGVGNVGGALNAGLGRDYGTPTVNNPISVSSAAGTGYYHSFTPSLPGSNAPNTFDNRIYQSNLSNAYGTPMETWSNGYDPNKLSPGAQKIHQAIADASLRRNQPVDFFSGKRPYNPGTGTLQHPLGQAIDIRINDPITGKPVGFDKIGERAFNPIGDLVNGERQDIPAMSGPYRDFAKDVIGSFNANPGVYGDFGNQRWGGAFGGTWGKDYMHFDEGKVSSGVSPAQAALRNEAFSSPTQVAGVLSAPEATSPIRVAQAGMGVLSSLFGTAAAAEPPAAPSGQPLNAPYSNLFDKTDRLDVAQNTVPSWQQSTYTGPAPTVPGSTVANTVPSWQQSTYSGPIQTTMATPSVAPSQQGENIPFPVDTNSFGYKTWRGMTRIGDALLPGSGTMLRAMDDDLRQRWPSMTNAERQDLIDKWNGRDSQGPTNVTNVVGGAGEGPKRGGDGPITIANNQPTDKPQTQGSKPPSSEPESTSWKQDALKYGFTEDQLKDPEIAAYIKQLWEMGWIPKTANA